MDRIIGRCGLICTDCPAYKANQNDDINLREKTAKYWSKIYNAEIKPEDIFCEGCLSDKSKNLFSHCSVCEIRQYGINHNIDNCSECKEYKCSRIKKFFEMVPEAEKVLDSL